MFDQAPPNLPVEPQQPSNGPAPLPPLDMSSGAPRPAESVPRPAPSAPMAGGAMMPKKQEPEDIFGDLERSAAEPQGSAAPLPSGSHGGGRGMRTALIVVGVVAVVAVLGIGGYMAYDRYIAKPSVTPAPEEMPKLPSQQDTTIPTEITPNDDRTFDAPPELPPAVEPTPAPEDIPLPIPVNNGGSASVDTDGDGLTDERESATGSNPAISDTDGDGLTDGEEVDAHGSSPTVKDSDGDGLDDDAEVRVWSTSPVKADTDGDSYADGTEVRGGFNPNGPGKLSPANPQ